MGFVDFLISKLVGYDILKSEKELKASLENAQRELSAVTSRNDKLMKEAEYRQGEIVSAQTKIEKANEEIALSKKHIERLYEDFDAKVASYKELEEELATKGQENKKLSETIQTKDNVIDDLTVTISSKEKEIEQLASSVRSKVTEIESLTTQVKEKESDIEQITRTLSSKEYEISELSEKVETLTTQNRSKQGTIMNHVKKINSLSEEIDALKEENGKLNQEHLELVNLRENYSSLENEKNSLESQIDQINTQKQSLETTNQELNNKISSLEEELANAPLVKPEDIRELEAQIQKNEETIQEKNREIEVLKLEKKDGETRFNEVCNELKSVRSEKDSLSDIVNDLERQNANLRKDNAALEKRLSEFESELASPATSTENEDIEPEIETDETEEILPEEGNQNLSNIEEDSPAIDTVLSTTIDEPDELSQDNDSKRETETTIGAKTTVKKSSKSKEEETIEMGDGSIVDLPPITNDSNRIVQRSIEYVFDENGLKVYADEFFNRSAEEIAQVGRKMSEAELSGVPYWTCGLCHRRVKIAHRTYNGHESLFFIHANRDHYCPWIKVSRSSKDDVSDELVLASGEIVPEETESDYKPKSRELKEKIYAALTSQASEIMGITDVRIDEIIRSNVPYMKWRRPDISFLHNGRKVVIELQKKSHDIDTIVDRDVFFRLNDIQILWVFGSDSDSSYDYMRKLSYKNTMFDNHRNVFVFDKEAQATSEENGTLYLKCNWLDEDDSWYFRLENSGANGKLVNINDLIYDVEYCKPYHFDANEEYFAKHPEARDAYLATKMTREELKKSIEDKWTRDSNYEEAQATMRQRDTKATPYCVMGLWGFRFNTTAIIPPIFTAEPKDLYNGFYAVRQDDMLGIVNYYGEKIVDWDGGIIGDDVNYDPINKRILFCKDGLWGVAEISGKVLIPNTYQTIQCWNKTVYRVKKNGKWGLCDTDNHILIECKYDKIDELSNSRAVAVRTHPTKGWLTVSGFIDASGQELYTSKSRQQDGLYIVQTFELWGIINEDGETVIPCNYEEVLPWARNLYRIRENGKWGIYSIEDHSFLLKTAFDSIGELNNGVAKTVFAKVESAIDISGKEVSQQVIQLQNGLKKTMVAGKWGIVNDKGEVIIEHRYNEIGSFRSRLIGVINDKEVIKLNLNYDYPIHITGKYLKTEGSNHYFNIGAALCILPEGLLKQAGKTLVTVLNPNKECVSLAFGNIIRNKYLLRVVDTKGLNKKLSHGDLEDSFIDGIELTGTVVRFKSHKGMKRKMIVRFPNGKETTVPRRFFTPATVMDGVRAGQSITLKKTGYDKENDQTIWNILKIG